MVTVQKSCNMKEGCFVKPVSILQIYHVEWCIICVQYNSVHGVICTQYSVSCEVFSAVLVGFLYIEAVGSINGATQHFCCPSMGTLCPSTHGKLHMLGSRPTHYQLLQLESDPHPKDLDAGFMARYPHPGSVS